MPAKKVFIHCKVDLFAIGLFLFVIDALLFEVALVLFAMDALLFEVALVLFAMDALLFVIEPVLFAALFYIRNRAGFLRGSVFYS
jgi:hypothetical protein